MEVIQVERGHEGVLTVKTAMYYWAPEATGCWLLLKWTWDPQLCVEGVAKWVYLAVRSWPRLTPVGTPG